MPWSARISGAALGLLVIAAGAGLDLLTERTYLEAP